MSIELASLPSSSSRLHTRDFRLPCTPPFELRHSLTFLRGFGPTRDEQEVTDTHLTKALMVGPRVVAFRVGRADAGQGPELAMRIFSGRTIGDELAGAVHDRVRFFLGADEELGPFYALAAHDQALLPLVERLRGLHHVKFLHPFEAACWAVINQRTRLPVARRMKETLVRAIGEKIAVDGISHWAFPPADKVAGYPEEELSLRIGSARKARAIGAVARAFARVDEEFLRRGPLAEVSAWLREIHGVGPFTTGFVLFRGLGRFQSAPLSAPLKAAAEKLYGRSLTNEHMARLCARYGAWGGHWMLYLWASTFF